MALFSGKGADEPDSAPERFHEVRSRVQAASGEKNPAMAFLACDSGAGASTVALGMAAKAVLCQQTRVLLVDANLRTPALHERLGCAGDRGLVELLDGSASVDEVVQWPGGLGFAFIASGRGKGNPAAACGSPRLEDVVRSLKERFDLVVFDGAPITPYPDAVLVARRLDSVVLVLEEGVTRWEVARMARQRLERAGVRLAGAIINKKRHPIPRRLYDLL